MLQANPNRTLVITWLSDLEVFEVYMGKRGVWGEIEVWASHQQIIAADPQTAWLVFCAFAGGTLVELGYNPPTPFDIAGEVYAPLYWLGSSGSSKMYGAVLKNNTDAADNKPREANLVCKVYTAHDCCCCGSDSAGVADEECTACCSWALELAALQVIADAQATLPKLVQYDVAQRILITTPVVKVIRKGKLHSTAFVRQLFDGLKHLHDRGLVHCNIEPKHIGLDPSGHAAIIDFSLCRKSRTPFTANVRYAGTVFYAADDVLAALQDDTLDGNHAILPEFHHDAVALVKSLWVLLYDERMEAASIAISGMRAASVQQTVKGKPVNDECAATAAAGPRRRWSFGVAQRLGSRLGGAPCLPKLTLQTLQKPFQTCVIRLWPFFDSSTLTSSEKGGSQGVCVPQ
eukprot:TRINITY_DN1650_c0_g3_i2.p1 TRINITY_DN1650_c0_g3~~TRINITY_DN1650_c0_g3_i2.p1  ORF type:complete len:403 (-),score=82.31 TRINITY_DN1650_c0_g3_i2:45-1253(-)